MKTWERNAFSSSKVPAALRGCHGMASALCSAGQTYSLLYFLSSFIFLSLSDIPLLLDKLDKWIIAHSYCTAKQLPCSEQTALPSLEYKSQLSLREGYSPRVSGDRALLASLPCVWPSDFSVSFVSLVLLCCIAQGVTQLQRKFSCQGLQSPAHTAREGEVPNPLLLSSFRTWVPTGWAL